MTNKYFYYNRIYSIIQLPKEVIGMILKKEDLHTHSIYSDGSNTPKEQIE